MHLLLTKINIQIIFLIVPLVLRTSLGGEKATLLSVKGFCSPGAGGVTPRFCNKTGGKAPHDSFFIRGLGCAKPLDGSYCPSHLKGETEWHQMRYLTEKGQITFQKPTDPLYAHNINGVRKPLNDDSLLAKAGSGENSWKPSCDPIQPQSPSEKPDDLVLVPVLTNPPLHLPRTAAPPLANCHSERENFDQPDKPPLEDSGIEMKTFPQGNNHAAPRVLLSTDSDPEKALAETSPADQGQNHKPAGLVHLAIEETLMAAVLQSCSSDHNGLETTSKKCDDSIKVATEIML